MPSALRLAPYALRLELKTYTAVSKTGNSIGGIFGTSLMHNKISNWHFLGRTTNRQPTCTCGINRQPLTMLKNYFIVALRNLRNNKAFASLNIAGLAIGMATAILIGLWISDELNFDHYNPNYKKLAKIMITQTHGGVTYDETTITMPLGYTLETKYRDLFKKVALISFPNGHVLASGDKKISGYGIYAQELFPSMFGLTVLTEYADAQRSFFGYDRPVIGRLIIR